MDCQRRRGMYEARMGMRFCVSIFCTNFMKPNYGRWVYDAYEPPPPPRMLLIHRYESSNTRKTWNVLLNEIERERERNREWEREGRPQSGWREERMGAERERENAIPKQSCQLHQFAFYYIRNTAAAVYHSHGALWFPFGLGRKILCTWWNRARFKVMLRIEIGKFIKCPKRIQN